MLYHCLRSLLETRSTFCVCRWLAGEGTHWMSLKYVHLKRNEIYFDDIILCNYPSFSFKHEQETAFFAFFTLTVGVGRGWCHKKLVGLGKWVTEAKNTKSWKKFGLFWQQQVFVSENRSRPALLTWRHSPTTSSCYSCVLRCVLHYFMRL